MLGCLPCSPSPEVDVIVVEVLDVYSKAGIPHRLTDIVKERLDSGHAVSDHICYMLDRLQDQDRSPAFAVRVVWNESLADLRSEDLAAFAFVFDSAPQYLCPESIPYGESVAYWLGY